MSPTAGAFAPVALLVLASLLGACAGRSSPSALQGPARDSRFFNSATRRPTSFEKVLDVASKADLVFFGEQHDDPATHRAELSILAALGSRRSNVVLSLEMFERDVQPVLDDYLAGRLSESDFLARSRPWERYVTDYRALVELARARGWAVIASNVPRKIAGAVSRKGLMALDSLPPAERAQAARELSCPHDAYYTRFAAQMMGHSAGGGPTAASDSATLRAMTDRFYESQCLKDETMGESIAAALAKAGKGAIVVHFNGAFHTDFAMGTAERAKRRAPAARTVVITAVPVDNPDTASGASYAERGDFVVLTRKPPVAAAK